MARILVLQEDSRVRKKLLALFSSHGDTVVLCFTLSMAHAASGEFDLYVCSALGKHSDGLVFALEKAEKGGKVVVVGHRQKFSRIPFVNIERLAGENAYEAFELIMAGG